MLLVYFYGTITMKFIADVLLRQMFYCFLPKAAEDPAA